MRKRVVGSVVATLAALAGFSIVQFMADPADAIRVTPKTDIQCFSKVAVPDQLTEGQDAQIDYTITVKNLSTVTANGVTINDILPGSDPSDGNAVYDDASSTGTCAGSNSSVSCNIGSLAGGGQASVIIAVDITNPLQSQVFSDSASVSSTTADSDLSNNSGPQCQVDVLVQGGQAVGDLECLEKSATGEVVEGEGGTLTYLVTVKNNGPDEATDVTISDVLPAGAIYDDAASSPECAAGGPGVVCVSPSPVAAGATYSATIVVDIPAGSAVSGASFTNQASVSGTPNDDTTNDNGPACQVITEVTEVGDEGCTPGYWQAPEHQDEWALTGFDQSDDFDATFGVDLFDPNITLGVAITLNGGGVNKLARHGTAALLSAAHPGVDYPFTVAQVIALVQAGDADALAAANELGCPLN